MCDSGSIEWIYDLFGDCISTTRDKISFAVGLSSNFLWICSAIPQIYQNCVTKKVTGQHPFFIGALLMGDILSLIGLLITHGLATQIITNSLYVLLDGIMFTQYVVFNYCCKGDYSDAKEIMDESDENGMVEEERIFQLENECAAPSGIAMLSAMAATATAMDWSTPYNKENLIGTIFGWCGCMGYMLSGEPQIHKNCDRQSVEDVSPYYLGLIISGNATYTIAVCIRSMDPSFLWQQAPWIIGSIWPMCADIVVCFQMCYYRRKQARQEEVISEYSLPRLSQEKLI